MMHRSTDSIRITAILPNYNSMAFLSHSIQSLLNQTMSFAEIIIVDDGSTDSSLAIIYSFMEKHKNIRLVKHEKNQGVCAALNTGIVHATGDYVMLCAADDWYSARCVELTSKIINKYPSVGLVCGDAVVRRFDRKANFYRQLPFPANQIIDPSAFKLEAKQTYAAFNGGGMFINRQAILSAGLLRPQLQWHCDMILYFVIAFRQGVYYINETFVNIDIRREGYSQGVKDWKIQKQVLLNMVKTIRCHYPDVWNNFKDAAVLPHYSIRYINWFIFNTTLRSYLSIKLLWKLLISNALVIRVGRLFPYHLILSVRKLLKA